MMKRSRTFTPLLAILMIMLSACGEGDNGLDNVGIYWIECSGSETDETVYYVSKSGKDKNSGTSENEAFGTIARALKEVKPGGTVRILPGVYNEGIGMISCGSSSAPITITGYGGVPTLDGENKKAIGLFFEECSNCIVSNIRISRFTDIGIGFTGGTDLELSNLEITENGHAVQLKDWELEGYGIHVEISENIRISYCDVYRNGPEPQIIPDYIMGTGINTYGNTNVMIDHNKSHNNIGGGILVEDSYGVIVEENEVYENDLDATADEWWDGGLWVDGGMGVIVRNNHFYDNLGPGIEISDEDSQHPTGYVLTNNVSTGNYYGIFIWNFGTTDWPSETIIERSGNEFSGNSRQDVWIEDWY